MLTIRQEQMLAFGNCMFERWMARHLAEFFHDEISGLAHAEILGRIRAGAAQARRYGFSADADLCRYIDLTFVLGTSFDRDPSLPWASDILRDERFTDPAMRMDVLYEAAQDHIELLEEGQANDEVDA
jgi:hypothetical protein